MDDDREDEAPQLGLRGYRLVNPERTAARKREVMLAAAQVFARVGYDAATLDAVAEQMGATKAAIYYHFRSKEDLYNEIRTTATHGATRRLEAIIARGCPPDVTLRLAVTDLVQLTFNDLDHASIILGRPAGISAKSRRESQARGRQYEMLVRSILEDGIHAGLFFDRDPAVMSFLITRCCLDLATWYKADGRLAAAAVAEQVIDQVLFGVVRPDARALDGDAN